MFSSPERSPEYYQDPFLKMRFRMLKAYNAQLSELRVNGVKDHVGHRVYGAEKVVRSILTSAINQTDRARSLEVLEAIKTATAAKLEKELPKPINAAA